MILFLDFVKSQVKVFIQKSWGCL